MLLLPGCCQVNCSVFFDGINNLRTSSLADQSPHTVFQQLRVYLSIRLLVVGQLHHRGDQPWGLVLHSRSPVPADPPRSSLFPVLLSNADVPHPERQITPLSSSLCPALRLFGYTFGKGQLTGSALIIVHLAAALLAARCSCSPVFPQFLTQPFTSPPWSCAVQHDS